MAKIIPVLDRICLKKLDASNTPKSPENTKASVTSLSAYAEARFMWEALSLAGYEPAFEAVLADLEQVLAEQ
jgi:hypothetical protein